MEIGDVVRYKKINNKQKMVIERLSENAVRCRYFDDDGQLHTDYSSKINILKENEYKLWNKQQIRLKKLDRLNELE